MSLCELCPRPGRCCSGFELNGGDIGLHATELEVSTTLAELGFPFFHPLWRKPDGAWLSWCDRLTKDGRCGDYENRPQLCRDYQPLACSLCALTTNQITAEAFGCGKKIAGPKSGAHHVGKQS